MSNVTTTPATTPVKLGDVAPPPDPTQDTTKAVADILTWGLSLAFPASAPLILGSEAVLMKLVPWIILAVEKKNVDPATLRAMQADLNGLGPSFPNAGGYSNAFAGGPNPAPGTNPTQAPPQQATVTVNGVTITLSADSLNQLVAFLSGLIANAPKP